VKVQRRSTLIGCVALALVCSAVTAAEPPPDDKPTPFVATRSISAPEAHQAATADERFVYAVSSTGVTQYDRKTGAETARSTGEAKHLNSAYVWNGKVYCAHSNYPRKPDESDIRVLDPATMKLTIFHTFEQPPGSLTWAIRRDGNWWCHFAHYGKDNAQSVLVRYDDNWREAGRWTSPPELVSQWGQYSLSGGVWSGDTLLVTGHDKRLVYRLRIPKEGTTLELVETIPCPFPGQGIAIDADGKTLIGIDRGKKQVVFSTQKPKQ
jgi:hypothetical protein